MTALQRLQELDHQRKLEAYPNTPRYAIAITRFNDKTSNGLTQCILRWLELHGHYCTRINTMGRQLPTTTIVDVIGRAHVTQGKWIPGTTKRGTADVHSCINGRHVSIEVKVRKDRMSNEQHKTKEAIERCGGVYFIAKDFDSFLTWYNGIT